VSGGGDPPLGSLGCDSTTWGDQHRYWKKKKKKMLLRAGHECARSGNRGPSGGRVMPPNEKGSWQLEEAVSNRTSINGDDEATCPTWASGHCPGKPSTRGNGGRNFTKCRSSREGNRVNPGVRA